MKETILQNVLLGGDDEGPVCISVSEGVIRAISADSNCEGAIDLGGATLLPGFIDIHNHGAVGIDVNDADSDGLIEIGRFLLRAGVTSWVPTIVPDSDEVYLKVTDAVSKAIRSTLPDVAEIVGIHYEGIYSNRRVCGALRPEYFKEYKRGDLDLLPSVEGLPHILTFAPEVNGGMELAEDIVSRGWIPSIGHTDAGITHLESAYSRGVRQVTHLFNAMTGIHHRELGVAGWAISKQDVSCEMIADGIHVAEQILRLALLAKGSAGLMLVSDSIAPTGLGDGEFRVWGEDIVVENLKTRNVNGSIAGSVVTLADSLERMLRLGASGSDCVRMLATNQSRRLGLHDRGEIEVGKKADLVAVDSSGQVVFVMKSGEVIRSDG